MDGQRGGAPKAQRHPPPHVNALERTKHGEKRGHHQRHRKDGKGEAHDALLQVLVAKNVYVGYLLHVVMVPHAEKCQNGKAETVS